MNKMLLDEVVPILPLDQEDCKKFAATVLGYMVGLYHLCTDRGSYCLLHSPDSKEQDAAA